MKILRRYILREHVGPFIAALGVLTGLMLLNQLARRFSDLVGKGLPWYVIAEVFGLSIPFILAMVVPMAVLVAALYTFNRLTGDNEVTAFKASGISLLRLMVPVLIAATLLAGGMVWFSDTILPESNHALRKLLSDIGRKRPTFELRERVVNEVIPGKLFLQAARIDRMRSVLWDMTIFDLQRPNVQRTIYADSGYMAFNEEQTDLYLTLFDGSMHETDAREARTDQSTYYGKQVIRVPEVSNELERGRGGDWRSDREMSIGMMRAEVEEQRERLNESRDSLATLLALLRPVRALPDTMIEEPVPPADSTESDARQRRLRETLGASADTAAGATANDSAAPAAPATPAAPDLDTAAMRKAIATARGDTARISGAVAGSARENSGTATAQRGSAANEQADSLNRVRAEDMRRRYRRPRASAWPPDGSAILFASQMRSRLERIAARVELQQREMNRFEVEIEKKFAIPAAAIVFILIGAPVAVRFPRGGIGMVIGVSLVVFSVYYIFLIGGEDFADRDLLSPFWAMWAPNVIFSAIGLVLLAVVTLGGTTRASLTHLVPAYGRARLAAARVTRRARVEIPAPSASSVATGSVHPGAADRPTTVEPGAPRPAAQPPARPADAVEPAEAAIASEPPAAELPDAIDIDRATVEELARLPGIGLTRAASIVNWRDQHGPFQQLTDLLAVPGIGPATLRRLEGKVRLGRDSA